MQVRTKDACKYAQMQQAKRNFWELAALAVLVVNLLLVMVSTLPAMQKHAAFFVMTDVLALAFFCVEYAARVWLAGPRWAERWRYMRTPLALLDALTLLPSLVVLGTSDLAVLRLVRLLAVFRVLRLLRYQKAAQRMRHVLRMAWPDLVVVGVLIAVFAVCSGSVLYWLEHEAQPQVFSSIPAALWWAVITITTVGYGDIVPTTGLGKLVAAACAFAGVLLIAVPTSIIASAYMAAPPVSDGDGESRPGEDL